MNFPSSAPEHIGSRWAKVAGALRRYATSPSAAQVALGEKLDIRVEPDLPFPLARERLRSALELPLALPSSRPSSASAADYLHGLEDELQLQRTDNPEDLPQSIVRALIETRLALRDAQSLETIRPGIGDIVKVVSASKVLEGELSSIGADGQLHLKGGLGRRGRPNNCEIVARVGEDEHSGLRYKVAQNVASLRSDIDNGYSRMGELAQWRVDEEVSHEAIAALNDALSTSLHESGLQDVLEKFPELLAQLVLGNHGAFVIPQKRLGGAFIPDFVVGGVTSLGFRWVLVELESPSANFAIQDGQGSHQLRKGVNQVHDWRSWLEENLATARASKTNHGLGLPGIRSDAEGLVLIGREDGSSTSNALRNRLSSNDRIEVRTYDWLTRTAISRMQGNNYYPFGVPDQAAMDASLGELDIF